MGGGVVGFRETLGGNEPPAGTAGALEALWWAGKGDWERAHRIVAAREGEAAFDRVHALLHRMEGDAGNARYWYRRAGVAPAEGGTDAEWVALVGALVAAE